MKAIVMAGGEGTRLRPLTCRVPKPMLNIAGRPVLEHMLLLLKENGIDSVCMTLGYLPDTITGYFGDGEELGMNIEYRVEKTPLGTAGGVRSCLDFTGDEDFLVISGDAVCDFDLKECISFHREKNSEATIVLYRHPNPLEYGLVLTGDDGRIRRFIEKPSWDRVYTNMINTGIYILSPSVLADIRAGEASDFGRDVFPGLLRSGGRLYGAEAEGYWCDVGSPEAFLQCSEDILAGKCRAGIKAEKVRGGVWSDSAVPEDATVIPPVFIGKGAVIGRGAKIGPSAVLNGECRVEEGARLRCCVLDGVHVGKGAGIEGAVLGRGVSVGEKAEVAEGCVIGDGTIIGDRCLIAGRARIWDGREIPAGTKVTENIVSGMLRSSMAFSAGGTMGGIFNITITPENFVSLGAAAGRKGRAGIAKTGGAAADAAAKAFSSGVISAGGTPFLLDSGMESEASYSGEQFGLDICAFIRQTGDFVEIGFFDEYGMKLTRAEERKFENALSGDQFRAGTDTMKAEKHIDGTDERYAAGAAGLAERDERAFGKGAVEVAAEENGVLRRALAMAGFSVCRAKRGIPSFSLSCDGFSLSARDEAGKEIDPAHMQVIAAIAEMEYGGGVAAVPYSAPLSVEIAAHGLGAVALRAGRDGAEAEKLLKKQRFMWDGLFECIKICACMRRSGETLSALSERAPRFSTAAAEVGLVRSRGEVMRSLSDACCEMAEELVEGIRLDTGRGWISIRPSADAEAIKISAECEDEETAMELCTEFERLTREIDMK